MKKLKKETIADVASTVTLTPAVDNIDVIDME